MTIIAYLYHVRLECVGPVRLFSVYRIPPLSKRIYHVCIPCSVLWLLCCPWHRSHCLPLSRESTLFKCDNFVLVSFVNILSEVLCLFVCTASSHNDSAPFTSPRWQSYHGVELTLYTHALESITAFSLLNVMTIFRLSSSFNTSWKLDHLPWVRHKTAYRQSITDDVPLWRFCDMITWKNPELCDWLRVFLS